MTQTESPDTGFFASFDRSRGQIVSIAFGGLFIAAGALVFAAFDIYALSESDLVPIAQLDRWNLLATRYTALLLILSAYLFGVGGLFLMSQRRLTLPIVLLVIAGAAATILLSVMFLDRFPAVVAAPLILVFLLIAPGNVLGRISLIVGAAVLMGVVILISVLRADLGVSADVFTHEGREYYLLINNSVTRFSNDSSLDDDGLFAYACDGGTCFLVYPCETEGDTACLDRTVVREASEGQ